MNKSRAVVTVIGNDSVGILAKVSTACAEADCNVIEVNQAVLEEFFCMIMIIDINQSKVPMDQLEQYIGNSVPSMKVHVMHENIFNSMHRI